jgi:hypothetical protein
MRHQRRRVPGSALVVNLWMETPPVTGAMVNLEPAGIVQVFGEKTITTSMTRFRRRV